MILEHCHRLECKQHIDALNAEIARLRDVLTQVSEGCCEDETVGIVLRALGETK